MTNEEARAAGMEAVTIEFDDDEYRQLEELAKADGVTPEEELRLCLRFLEKLKKAEANK